MTSLLEGKYAYDWAPWTNRGAHAVSRCAARLAALQKREHHVCTCGLRQDYCVTCGAWYCEAPGHLKHACAGAR